MKPGRSVHPGARGVYQSHLAILEEAAEAAVIGLLILEDDCDFVAGCRAVRHSPKRTGRSFYGGYEASDPDNLPGQATSSAPI